MSQIRPAITNAVAKSQGLTVSSATDGAFATSPRSATVIAAAMATAVMIDRVASSIRRSSGGRYMRLGREQPDHQSGEDERPGKGQCRCARREVARGRAQRQGRRHRSRARSAPRTRSDALVDRAGRRGRAAASEPGCPLVESRRAHDRPEPDRRYVAIVASSTWDRPAAHPNWARARSTCRSQTPSSAAAVLRIRVPHAPPPTALPQFAASVSIHPFGVRLAERLECRSRGGVGCVRLPVATPSQPF